MKSIILINCISVKKKSGGAFQVAKNFIENSFKNSEFEWHYIISTDLYAVFSHLENINMSGRFYIIKTQPDFKTFFKVKKDLKKIENKLKPDLVYTIASPSYFRFNAPEVMRFTNSWVVDKNKFAYDKLTSKQKIKQSFYHLIQIKLIKKCLYFITQTEACKNGIKRITSLPLENIKVVPNTLPIIYNKYSHFVREENVNKDNCINIFYVAAPHTNKNIEIIPYVISYLKNKIDCGNIRFHITIPKNALVTSLVFKEARKLGVEKNIVNHGYCNQEKLADLFKNSQIFFFPSLLETFSASLLEAIFFKLPIVASNFMFNKEIADGAALYFEPLNADDAANKILSLINDKELYHKLILNAKKIENEKRLFFDYKENFNEIIKFLKYVIEQSKVKTFK